jgi:hypothetical protein
MNTKDTNDGRPLSEADAAELEQEELKYFKNEKAILDAPLTNRAFLLGIAYLAEVISRSSDGTAHSVKDAERSAWDLHEVLLDDIK